MTHRRQRGRRWRCRTRGGRGTRGGCRARSGRRRATSGRRGRTARIRRGSRGGGGGAARCQDGGADSESAHGYRPAERAHHPAGSGPALVPETEVASGRGSVGSSGRGSMDGDSWFRHPTRGIAGHSSSGKSGTHGGDPNRAGHAAGTTSLRRTGRRCRTHAQPHRPAHSHSRTAAQPGESASPHRRGAEARLHGIRSLPAACSPTSAARRHELRSPTTAARRLQPAARNGLGPVSPRTAV